MRKFLLAMLVLMLALSVAVVAIACDNDTDPKGEDPNGEDPNGEDPNTEVTYIGIKLEGDVRGLDYSLREDLANSEFFSGTKGVGKVQSNGKISENLAASREIVQKDTKYYDFVNSLSFANLGEEYVFVPTGDNYTIQEGNTVKFDIVVDEDEFELVNIPRVVAKVRNENDRHLPGAMIGVVTGDGEDDVAVIAAFGEDEIISLYGVPVGSIFLAGHEDDYELDQARLLFPEGAREDFNRETIEENGIEIKDYGKGLNIVELTLYFISDEPASSNITLSGNVRDLNYNPRTDLHNTEYFSGENGVGRIQSNGKISESVGENRGIFTEGMKYYEFLDSLKFKSEFTENYLFVATGDDYTIKPGDTVNFDVIIDTEEIEVVNIPRVLVKVIGENDRHLPGAMIGVVFGDGEDDFNIVATFGEDPVISLYGVPVGSIFLAGHEDDYELDQARLLFPEGARENFDRDTIEENGIEIKDYDKGEIVELTLFFVVDEDSGGDTYSYGRVKVASVPGDVLQAGAEIIIVGTDTVLAVTDDGEGGTQLGITSLSDLEEGTIITVRLAGYELNQVRVQFPEGQRQDIFRAEIDENGGFVVRGFDLEVTELSFYLTEAQSTGDDDTFSYGRVKVASVPGDALKAGAEIIVVGTNEVLAVTDDGTGGTQFGITSLSNLEEGTIITVRLEGFVLNQVRVQFPEGQRHDINRTTLDADGGFVVASYSDLEVTELYFMLQAVAG